MKTLFVRTGNSFRSPVAEAIYKKIVGDNEVDSAGITPASRIASNARRLLEEENASIYLEGAPEDIDEKRLEKYDRIIVMEEHHKEEIVRRHPELEGRIVVGGVEDPVYLPPGYQPDALIDSKSVNSLIQSSLTQINIRTRHTPLWNDEIVLPHNFDSIIDRRYEEMKKMF